MYTQFPTFVTRNLFEGRWQRILLSLGKTVFHPHERQGEVYPLLSTSLLLISLAMQEVRASVAMVLTNFATPSGYIIFSFQCVYNGVFFCTGSSVHPRHFLSFNRTITKHFFRMSVQPSLDFSIDTMAGG